MRLVCPRCAAQYEVGDDAIPSAGRDVQCSDCGHAWFYRRAVDLRDSAPVPLTAEPNAARVFTAPAPQVQPVMDDPPDAPVPPPPPRKPLDEHVMAILREEALREAAARRADAARAKGLEPRPGAPSDPATPPGPAPALDPVASPGPARSVGPVPLPAAAAPRPADPQVPSVPPEPSAPLRPAARRELLPDIEEINSTLTGAGRRGDASLRINRDRRPGFRAGFGLMLLLVALAAGTYVMAPRIAALLPQSAEALTTYVGTVDHLRRQLDATMTSAQERVESLLISVE